MRIVLLLLALVSLAQGQISSGSIFGQIKDESGGAVAGTAVTAQRENTGFVRATVTDGAGAYRFEDLAPGTYSVRAERAGFKVSIAPRVTLEVSQYARVDLQLKVGEGHDSIVVTAAVSPLRTQDSSVGYRIDSPTLTQLPLDERNVMSLVTIGPGAIPRQLSGFVHDANNDIQQGSRGSVALNPPINGARSDMNSFLLDGANNTDGNTFAITVIPPMESVQEFRIQSSLAPAAFSQAGGGVVDIVTKSGGREFHGSAFEHFRNEATDARNYFDNPSLPRSIFRRNQFGGSLGGRLPLPSTFFFATYEGLRGKAASPALQLVPDAQLRAGNFQGRSAALRSAEPDPLGRPGAILGQPHPGRSNRPHRAKVPRPVRAASQRFGGSSGNYLDTTPSTSNHDEVSARIDHQFRRHGLLFGRYTINDERGGIGGQFPLRPTSEKVRAQQAVLGHTLAGVSWANELRASFTRLRLFDIPLSASQKNVAADLGILNPPSDPFSFGLPYFFVAGFSSVTDDPTLPQIQRDNTWGITESVSLVRGRRTYKFGVHWSDFQFNYRQSNKIRGQYTYSGAFTANGTDPQQRRRAGGLPPGVPALHPAHRRELARLPQAARSGRLRAAGLADHQPPFSDRRDALRVHLAFHGDSRSTPEPRLFDPASAAETRESGPRQ